MTSSDTTRFIWA